MLDEPRWIVAIAQRLHAGQRIEYFDPRANASRHGKVIELRRKQVLILDEDDGKRWLVAYAAINLDGADVRIRERKDVGVGRHELAEGDTVGFLDHEKRERSGIVQRLNDKTVTVISQGQKWRVAYSLLHRVVEIPAEEIRQAGVIGS